MFWQNYRTATSFILILSFTSILPANPNPYRFTPYHGSGIIFNRARTIILAERYDSISFLLPTPRLHLSIDATTENLTETFRRHWAQIPGDCPELRARAVPDTQLDDLIGIVRAAFEETQAEIKDIHHELNELLRPPDDHQRTKRYAPLLAAAAGAGLLSLGAQLTSGCIAGVLGPCHNEKNIAANRQALQATMASITSSNQHWAKVQETTDHKLYLLTTNMKELANNQKILQKNQQDMWNATQQTLHGLAQGLQTMTICTEYLFIRSQLNLLRNTITSRLQIIHASLQAFKAALWSYKATISGCNPWSCSWTPAYVIGSKNHPAPNPRSSTRHPSKKL